jgi:hypothetical protein
MQKDAPGPEIKMTTKKWEKETRTRKNKAKKKGEPK